MLGAHETGGDVWGDDKDVQFRLSMSAVMRQVVASTLEQPDIF